MDDDDCEFSTMSTFNHSSSYNRTYEKKVIEEVPRVRLTSIPFTQHVLPASFSSFPAGFSTSSSASLKTTDDSFHATLDVREYNPEDLKVSVIGQQIIIEGTTPEKQDDLGLITRTFTRKFALPPQVQPEAVTSNLTSDGILTIIALPPKPKESSPARSIPIKVVTSPGNSTQASPSPAKENGKS